MSSTIHRKNRVASGKATRQILPKNTVHKAIARLFGSAHRPYESLLLSSALTGISVKCLFNAITMGEPKESDENQVLSFVTYISNSCPSINININLPFGKRSVQITLPEALAEGWLALINHKDDYSSAPLTRVCNQLEKGLTPTRLQRLMLEQMSPLHREHVDVLTVSNNRATWTLYYRAILLNDIQNYSYTFQQRLLRASGINATWKKPQKAQGFTTPPVDTQMLHSALVKTKAVISRAFQSINNEFVFLNSLAAFTSLSLEVGLGCRPAQCARWLLPRLLSNSVEVLDKGPSSKRQLPLPKRLQSLIAWYYEKLEDWLTAPPYKDKPVFDYINDVYHGQRPAFFYIECHSNSPSVTPMTANIRKTFLCSIGITEISSLPLNAGRRHLQQHVRNEFSYLLADRWFGYDTLANASPAGVSGNLTTIANWIDEQDFLGVEL
ncbi:hypothetical protein [Agarivorans litoreus]|uniref:hypothetical protein n=1 Tax=Agarivorans litoreus TaxID=1510455 RepID=UPI001C7DC192|nr:hypothetical protein [Agarivorans litoreus]